jgi:hypothetical protein
MAGHRQQRDHVAINVQRRASIDWSRLEAPESCHWYRYATPFRSATVARASSKVLGYADSLPTACFVQLWRC